MFALNVSTKYYLTPSFLKSFKSSTAIFVLDKHYLTITNFDSGEQSAGPCRFVGKWFNFSRSDKDSEYERDHLYSLRVSMPMPLKPWNLNLKNLHQLKSLGAYD